MVLKTVAPRVHVGVAAEIGKDKHGRSVLVLRFRLDGVPDFSTEPVRTLNSANIEGIRSRMSYIDIMQRNPEQTGRHLPHQLLCDINRKLIRTGKTHRMMHKIID